MKKLGILLLVVVGGLFLFRKTNFCSYMSTAWSKVRNTAERQVPVEFEIDRVRHEIAKLDDDMRDHLGPIAEEMANIQELKDKVEVTRKNLKEQKISIMAMTQELEKGVKPVSIGDEEYTPEELRAKLDRDFSSYKRVEAELKSQEQILAAKEKALKTVQEQLASMKTLKRDLEVELAQLEADLRTVRLAQTRDKYQLDDTRLSDIKNSLQKIKHRLTVERTELELRGKFASHTVRPTKKVKPVGDLTKEVKNYFGQKSTAEDKIASSK
jgi:chromosome segregation ATPase